MEPVTIVGAGLVGSLLSICLAQRGYGVTVYERNADLRRSRISSGASINLTLCTRGFDALDRVGVGEIIRPLTVPIYGRIIHLPDRHLQWQQYGNNAEALLAISRNQLNEVLLDYAQTHFAIEVCFGKKCTGIDFSSLEVETLSSATHSLERHRANYILGADGAFSAVRLQLQQRYGFDYSQEYSSLGYKQLEIPISAAGWTEERNALHIWPRGESMLLAIPNRDGSFTGTLLLPLRGELSYESITTGTHVKRLFEALFPDALEKIPTLVDSYLSHRPIPMVTIRCSPWTYTDKVLLLGDAAHAILPSYGQGANAGFEDCAVFGDCVDRWDGDLAAAIRGFEELRKSNMDAIAELSKHHLIDLRVALGTPDRTLRDRLEAKLNRLYPASYLPLYTMVSFTNVPYAQAVSADAAHRILIDSLLKITEVQEDLDDPATDKIISDFVLRTGLQTPSMERP